MLVFYAIGSAAETLQPTAFTAEIGVSAMRFDYAELKNDGSYYDKELGVIPGLSLKFSQRLERTPFSGNFGHDAIAHDPQT